MNFKEYYEQQDNLLIEMANIDTIDQLKINVYTDHLPIHYHVIKKDEFEVRIKLSDNSIMSYKWQKDSKEISSKEMKDLKKWLKKKNKDVKGINNKDAILFSWKTMNRGN